MRPWVLAACLAGVIPGVGAAENGGDGRDRPVTVMTRNLYLGADVSPAIAAVAAGDPEGIVAAVSDVWSKVRLTDFPARAKGLAREIAEARPDLIGLQEAEIWRSQTPADFVPGNASHVEYDFVAILIHELEQRGLHYAVVAELTGIDAEFPGFLSSGDAAAGTLSDIRLTEREVILALDTRADSKGMLTRTDRKIASLTIGNAQSGQFAVNVAFPIAPGIDFIVLRGWASVDVSVFGTKFRFVTTHLEADSEEVREAQAREIVAGPANTTLPVILVGDANSNANGDRTTAAYNTFVTAGFADAWREAHPGRIVSTCCNAELLTNPMFPSRSDDEGRIDLVLYRGEGLDAGQIELTGARPLDRVFSGRLLLWHSDHAGVVATLRLR